MIEKLEGFKSSMKAEDYYDNIKSKWEGEYPSTKDMNEVWDFYKECGYKDPEKTLISILDKVDWKTHRVLDFGCDTGFMLKFICDYSSSLSGAGVDINKKAILEAQQKFPELRFEVFDGLNLPFKDKSFDLIFVSAVIKHIRYEDREKVYTELKRVSNYVFFIEADSKKKETVPHGSWIFYNSNFEEEFQLNFKPIKIIHEAGDLLGLYKC